jgi:hypothetical protein
MTMPKKRLIGLTLTIYGGLLCVLGFDYFALDAVCEFATGGFIIAIEQDCASPSLGRQ